MTFNKILLVLFYITSVAIFSSCSNDDDNNTEQSINGNDWMLEGSWKLKNKFSDDSFTMSDITFRTDGSGVSDNNKFRWYTHDRQLFISFDNGKRLEENYSISGASLDISNVGVFETELPMTGTWYACNAMKEFNGNTFCYHLNANGDGIKYTFDYKGLSAKTFFKWNRSRNGISIIYKYLTEEKDCSFSGDTININGEGYFTSVPPFYGHWSAVDCNEGLINKGDNNYSTLDISSKGDKNYFVCNYKTSDGNDYSDAMFQGIVKFTTTHQQFFDDQQIFIIQDVTGATDTSVINYRFFYYKPYKKVYLDLSCDSEINEFVRYELE